MMTFGKNKTTMNRIIFSVLFLIACLPSFAKEITTELTVTQATVYLKGAKVTASSQINLVKGKNYVRIESLPRDMNVATVSVQIPKTVDMMSIQPELQKVKEVVQDLEEKRLLDEIMKLQKQMELINIQMRTLQAEKNIIETNKQIVPHEKLTNVEQLEKFLLLYSKRVLEIDNSIFSLNEKKLDFQTKIQELNEKITQRKPQVKPQGYDVVLELDSKSDQACEIIVSYLVEEAGWVPSYDVRAQTSKKVVELTYKGKIYQNTGQEWNNVKLSVSSYRPNLNTQRPILHPMYVMEFVEPVYQPRPSQSAGMTNSYLSRDSKREDAPQAKDQNSQLDEHLADPATWNVVNDSPLSVIYELQRKHSIPSKREPQHVLLDKREITADYVYHVVPTINTEVHLLAKIKNWNELSLMGGEAFLFLGDNFVGKTNLNSQYANDELPIALGTDERIVVKRTRLNDKSETKKKGDEEIGIQSFEISFKNHLTFDIVLEILDQVPVSSSPKIVISEEMFGEAEYTKTTGALLWTQNLAAGKSGKVEFSYKITHPKGIKIAFQRR